MANVGRNEPCPCGSGKKYKRCHLAADTQKHSAELRAAGPIPDEARAEFERIQREQQALEAQGYNIPHIEVMFKGQRFRGVGSRLHWRPPTETFHEFLVALLVTTLGDTWIRDQRALPSGERHFIVLALDHHVEWKRRMATTQNAVPGGWSAVPDGWSRALISLALDVYSLLHRGDLPTKLLNRLKARDQYQGARYEIAIAGMMVRVGCRIRSLDRATSDPVARHCEFLATHEATGVEFGVEAKSRHRSGVLHTPGEVDQSLLLRGEVKDILERAMSQGPSELPFLIFLDINSPLTPPGAGPPEWVADVERFIQFYNSIPWHHPAPYSALFVTNYSYHFATDRETDSSEYAASLPIDPRIPIVDLRFVEYLKTGLSNYGHVPELP